MDSDKTAFVRIIPPEIPERFEEVDPRYFHGTFWPEHGRGLEALLSNFHPKKGKPSERPVYVIWGRRATDEAPERILAVVIADDGNERFWVAPASGEAPERP